MNNRFSTKQLDCVNKNGDPLCHAFGCRKHTRLIHIYGGLFCPNHVIELSKIRGKINQCKHGDVCSDTEVEHRTHEQLFRKQMCAGHMRYISQLSHIRCV